MYIKRHLPFYNYICTMLGIKFDIAKHSIGYEYQYSELWFTARKNFVLRFRLYIFGAHFIFANS